jgi:hypothetical protein
VSGPSVRRPVWLWLVLAAQIAVCAHTVLRFRTTHVTNRPFAEASGLWSALNAEWVSLMWAWLVLAAVLALFRLAQVNNRHRSLVRASLVRALLVVAATWTLLHSLEHLYLLVQYGRVNTALDTYGLPRSSAAELLPGVLGRDGWIAISAPRLRSWFGPLLSASRLSIELGWVLVETVLIGGAALLTAAKRAPVDPD